MKRVLVVVDMQNDFITGSLGTKEAAAILPKVIDKIKAYKADSQTLFFTRDTHFEDYLETAEGKKLPVRHCIQGEWGWEIEAGIQEVMDGSELIFNKLTFGATALGEKIKDMTKENPDTALEVELIGLCTDICVISNALLIKAFAPEATVKVDAACCAGVTPESHENALKAMAMCQIDIEN